MLLMRYDVVVGIVAKVARREDDREQQKRKAQRTTIEKTKYAKDALVPF